MSTMTLRVTSSAVNAAGTGLGQGPDLHAPSFYDAIITDSTNPNLPNGTYDAYCLHPLLTINFSPTLYDATSSDGENVADYIAADVAAITDTQIDQINWLLAQNFTADPIFAGQYNYGEVQAAIYELLGYTPAEYNIGITPDILSDNGRQTLERTDIDFLVAQAQAAIASGNNVVPTDAYFSALIDPEGNVQPLIVQLQSAKLGNFVWQDGNNNGIQDAGELGVNNVVVELYDNAGTLIATTTTGDDFSTAAVETGFYQFTGLQAGDYQVKFVPPANMALTIKDANSNGQDTLDSDADTTTGLSDIISLAAGESNQTIDAGLVQPTAEPASISGFVYCDDNDDGVKDAGEAGLGGVTVQLLNAAGAVVSTTTTGADGSYSFTGLAAGTYSVVEPTQPAGKNDGKETAGSTGGNTTVNDTISEITVNAGEDSVNNNFGEVTPTPELASISGFVYCDDNDDGVKDAGEAGLGGVTVQLLNAAGAVVSTTTTSADGSYSFTGLAAGTYSVVEPTQPAGKNDGKETAGSTGGDTSVNDMISQITVNAGEDSVNNNFGEVTPPPEPASISGFVYCDDNDDGVKDAGEAGLGGVTVQLLNAAGAVVSTTTTGADGSYSFTGLDAGTYSVVEPNQPAGKNDGKETAGSTGGNTTVNDTISEITVNAGEDSVNNNFGEVTPPPEPASISGFVYCDDNDDGVKDAGEAGLSGVTVQLLNAAGAVVSTTTTGADGSYSFTGLDAGTYSVVEPTQPAGKNDGKETAGSTGGNTTVNDTISEITVNAGEDSVNNNFGEVTPPPEPASISGFVYCDDNDDGVKDAGEAGLSGVTVQLLNAAGAVVSTTTTGADGSYSFTGLDAGTYSVVEPNQPAGKNDGKETAGSTGGNTTVNDTISEITVNAGEDSVNNNFGEVTPPPEPASISGFVYCDDNDDGVKDAGEAGLSGVTVQLLNAAGAVVSTTTTGADGSYSFTGLDAGTYSVVEPTQPAGKDDGKETAGSTGGNTDVNDTISQITVNAGEDSINNNFGEVTPPPEPASISGFVYCDDNDDGVKDAGEAGLGGVTVQLLNAAGAVVSTTTTDANGAYSFTGLDAGTYSVVEPTQPTGKNDGKETAGSTGGNTDVNDTISQITVDAGEDSVNNNFGEVTPPPEPASISGFVYCDDNDDGVKDAGEAGLSGVTVQLLNAAGTVVSTTTTDANGAYSFTGLDAGTYSVVEPTQPADKDDGKETAGSTGGNTDVNDTISQITVNAGEDSVNNNFGEVTPPPEPASISGFVYCDDNDDGVKDAGEAGLSGVTVQLLNAAGAVVSTTTTDANGAYSFTGLDAGTYSVVEPTQPAGKDDGKETAGSTGGNTDVNDTISQITVNAGEDSINNNFGEVTPPPEPASISGFVYCDDNDDGVKDAGEAGLSGVTVQLLNAAGAVVSTTTTGADGSYSFTGLDAGTYSVVEPTQPAGKDDGKETAGSTGGNTDVNDTISQITVNAGEDSVNNNFGEVTPPPEPASISGFVYCDDNDDGVKDAGEAGLGGVTVQLLNAAGAVVSTTTTGADGSYSFTGLDAGTYSVVEPTQPAGKDDGKETAGSTGGNTDVNDTISQITVDAGEDSVNNNFGEVTPPPEPASISGFVYCDDNDDGVKDAGEAGLSGVTVQLLNAAGAVVSTTTTDANGAYSFTGLDAGTYSVVEPTQPAGKDDGKETAGSTGGNTDVNDTISQITVNAGEDSINNNFGEVTPPPEPASISGFVYCDDNDDGVKDAGEAGLSGVTVQLLNAAGAVISTTTTGADGSYSFTGLDAGTYSVVEPSQPAGKNDGKETAGSTGGNTTVNDTISEITVNAGENSVNNNFGEITQTPDIDIEKFVNGIDVTDLNVLPEIAAGADVTFTYNVTNTGNVAFTQAEVLVKDDNGTPNNLADDFIPTLVTTSDVGSDGILSAGETWLYTSTTMSAQDLSTTTNSDANFVFSGSSSTTGSNGNIRTFTANGVTVDASAHSRSTSGDWSTGYVGAYNEGLGVTNSGNDGSHRVDNSGWVDYLLFEFDKDVTVDKTLLKSVVNDSDISIWIGDRNGADISTLSDGLLQGFTKENDFTNSSSSRWADINDGGLTGDTLVISAYTGGSNDHFKLKKITTSVSETVGNGEYVNIATVTADTVDDSDASGYVNPATAQKASIGDKIWFDDNGNGIQDNGEAGVSGVTVQLREANFTNGHGGAVLAQTTTDTNGDYLFSDLMPGDYQIDINESTLPAGYQFTTPDQGSNDDLDSDVIQTSTIPLNWGVMANTTLDAGEHDRSWDAGIVSHKASIGDRVWEDMNHNGIQDVGEPGISGITATLYAWNGSNQYIAAQTTTNGNGNYLFTNLDEGYYFVQFDKAGVRHDSGWGGNFNMSDWYWANKDAGTNDNKDSDVYKFSGDTTYTDWTYLSAGENDLSWDAGITPIVIDLDGDGVETISKENAQGTFDLLGTGNAIQSGWVGSDDGLLAIDTNNNGTIDDISELFGGSNKGDGFAKLASYDSNGDGVVNADDIDFSSLLVWQDANSNHETDAGELTNLVDAGIESLAVSFTELPFIDAQDNLHLERSSATLTNGTTVDMTDVYFNVALADAQAAGFDGPSLGELSGYDQVTPEEVVDVPSAFVVDPVWAV